MQTTKPETYTRPLNDIEQGGQKDRGFVLMQGVVASVQSSYDNVSGREEQA